MPTNLLLLPLLAGYWFVHFCYYFKFRAQQLEGYRLLIHSAFAGLVFLGAARLLTWFFSDWSCLNWVRQVWHEIAPLQFSGTAVLSLLLGMASPFAVNLFLGRDVAKALILRRSTDEFAKLLDSALRRDLPIALTLDNRKFYIGYVLRSPNLDPSERHVAILPMASGYRDPTTLTYKFTTNYVQATDTRPDYLTENDFSVVLPLGSIRSANIFDPSVYDRVFSQSAHT